MEEWFVLLLILCIVSDMRDNTPTKPRITEYDNPN